VAGLIDSLNWTDFGGLVEVEVEIEVVVVGLCEACTEALIEAKEANCN